MRDLLANVLARALDEACAARNLPAPECPDIEITCPPRADMGDFSTNLALILAARMGLKPREVAELLVAHVDPSGVGCRQVTIAGPGFINFHLDPAWLHRAVSDCLEQGARYGCSDLGAGESYHVEFVSANPVGPIHIGNARGGPFGDVLGNMLSALSYRVHKEYYVNDGPHNTQAIIFGLSLQARYRELLGLDFSFPEKGYAGDYVAGFARELIASDGSRHAGLPQDEAGGYAFFRLIEPQIVEDARRVMAMFGIEYDCWFHESDLYESGAVEAEIERLLGTGAAYRKDGAVWLRTAEHGDDEDRVLVRQDGRPTYIASDAAYGLHKYRSFGTAVYVLGPDHAGYVPRLKAAIEAGGIELSRVEIIVHQTVRLIRGGETVRLSKRRGEIIGLDEIVEEVGRDAARFFFLMRSIDSHLDFDLDLARKQSDENPVYYVQYAHARICSIERMATERGLELSHTPDLSLLADPAELALMRQIADYPHELQAATIARAPHRLTTMARELAAAFHQFYVACKVLDETAPELSAARMALVRATRQLLANQLELMGLRAPERM